MVQLSHLYMTTGKTIALTTRTFVGKVMSLLFNMLSGLVIAFLPRSNHLNFMAAVTIHSDFGTQERPPPLLRSFCFSAGGAALRRLPSASADPPLPPDEDHLCAKVAFPGAGRLLSPCNVS